MTLDDAMINWITSLFCVSAEGGGMGQLRMGQLLDIASDRHLQDCQSICPFQFANFNEGTTT